jgi:phage gp36-like protein
MAYATQDDLVPLRMSLRDLVDLTDDTEHDFDPGHGEVNTTVVDKALTEASARVDSFCGQRYKLPLQPSETVKGLTLDIVVFLLFTRRRETLPSETVGQRYEYAIRFLTAISNGKASLDQPVNAQAQGSPGEAVVTRIPSIFSDDNLRGW